MIEIKSELNMGDIDVIALEDNQIIGLGYATINSGVAHLGGLTVYIPYQRQGVGTKMLQEIRGILKQVGVSKIEGDFVPPKGQEREVEEFYTKRGIQVSCGKLYGTLEFNP